MNVYRAISIIVITLAVGVISASSTTLADTIGAVVTDVVPVTDPDPTFQSPNIHSTAVCACCDR
jgi:hypothetical protein